jgi:hypothetical protein
MADWAGQLIMAQRHEADTERRIAQRQQTIEQLRMEGADTTQSARLLGVLQQSLVRAKIHVDYIKHRLAAHKADADRPQVSSARVTGADSTQRLRSITINNYRLGSR